MNDFLGEGGEVGHHNDCTRTFVYRNCEVEVLSSKHIHTRYLRFVLIIKFLFLIERWKF